MLSGCVGTTVIVYNTTLKFGKALPQQSTQQLVLFCRPFNQELLGLASRLLQVAAGLKDYRKVRRVDGRRWMVVCGCGCSKKKEGLLFELHSQSMEERATLDRYHHFHGHSGMCA